MPVSAFLPSGAGGAAGPTGSAMCSVPAAAWLPTGIVRCLPQRLRTRINTAAHATITIAVTTIKWIVELRPPPFGWWSMVRTFDSVLIVDYTSFSAPR